MKKIVLLYKENYNDDKKEIKIFDSLEAAKNTASKMIELFRFWGGGSVPCSISIYKGNKEVEYFEYKESLYVRYARENGTIYGYYKLMHPKEIIRIA